MTTNDIDAIRKQWLAQCGPCDAGLGMECSHPDADERPVIAALCDEIEQLRAELAKTDEITTNIQTKLNAKVEQLHTDIEQLRAANDRLRNGLLAEAAAHRETRGQLTAANHHTDGLAADVRDMQKANTAYANEVARLRADLRAANDELLHNDIAQSNDAWKRVAR